MYIFLILVLIVTQSVVSSEKPLANPTYMQFQNDPHIYAYEYDAIQRFATIAKDKEGKSLQYGNQNPMQLGNIQKSLFDCLIDLPKPIDKDSHASIKKDFEEKLKSNTCKDIPIKNLFQAADYLDADIKTKTGIGALYVDTLIKLFPAEESWKPKKFELGLWAYPMLAGCILHDLINDKNVVGVRLQQSIDKILRIGGMSSMMGITYITLGSKWGLFQTEKQIYADIGSGVIEKKFEWGISSDLKSPMCGVSSDNAYLYRVGPISKNPKKHKFELRNIETGKILTHEIDTHGINILSEVAYNEVNKTFALIFVGWSESKNFPQVQFVTVNVSPFNLTSNFSQQYTPNLAWLQMDRIGAAGITEPKARRINITPQQQIIFFRQIHWSYVNNKIVGIHPVYSELHEYDPANGNFNIIKQSDYVVLSEPSILTRVVDCISSFIPDYKTIMQQKINNIPGPTFLANIVFDFNYLRLLTADRKNLYVTDALPSQLTAALHFMNTQYSELKEKYWNIWVDALYVVNAVRKTESFKKFTPNHPFVKIVSEPLLKFYPLYKQEVRAEQKIMQKEEIDFGTSSIHAIPSKKPGWLNINWREKLAAIKRDLGSFVWNSPAKITEICKQYPILCIAMLSGAVLGVRVLFGRVFDNFSTPDIKIQKSAPIAVVPLIK